jgi:hypothetical protein
VLLTASARPGATFAGWSGDCSGRQRCRLRTDGSHSATARFARRPAARTLTVQKTGRGDGRITSPSGIDCGSACRTSVERGAQIRLQATAAPGASFAGWTGGGCGGIGPCRVTVRDNVTITARFAARPVPPGDVLLTVVPAGSGSGTVTSDPPGISCRPDCSVRFGQGRRVVLTPAADEGSAFTGWSGAGCSGTGSCPVTLGEPQAVTATFDAEAPADVVLTTSVTGSGTIKPDCAQGCAYRPDADVSITATPGRAANTVRWTGCTTTPGDETTCRVTMSGDRRVSATFTFVEP